jgi:hypothetical protein
MSYSIGVEGADDPQQSAQEDEMKTEIYAHKHPVNGAWILSAIVGYERIERAYYFYNKREAMTLFRREIKKRKNIRGFADTMAAIRI